MTPDRFKEIMKINPTQWSKEIESSREFFSKFGETLPPEFTKLQNALTGRLSEAAPRA
jgi:GTP-dependent phosphoenolpyruvate carboxykinase